MKLNRLIIHELIKESGKTEVDYTPSENLLSVDDGLTKMIENIHESFEKSITSYHRFKTTSQSEPIYINAHKYINIDKTDKRFLSWSKTGMRKLEDLVKDIPFATGGFYVFSDYELKGVNFLSIVIVRNKDAFNITWDEENKIYSVDTTQNINIEQMAMGFRLNVNSYVAKTDRNYIAIISKRTEDASQYFKDWVCVDDGTSSKINTNNLIQIIKEIGEPYSFEGDEDDFLKHIHDTIWAEQRANKGYINVDRLSDLFYQDPSYLRTYAEESYGTELDSDFKVNTSSLKRLIRYKATVKGISVSLDVEHFQNETVELKDGSVIIKNRSIYNQLWQQRNEEN